MEPITPIVESTPEVVDVRPTCPHCRQPFFRRRWNQAYCTPKCQMAAWVALHPRKPSGSVLVPAGSRVLPPDHLAGYQASVDLIARGQVPGPAFVSQEGGNAVDLDALVKGANAIEALRADVELLKARPTFGRSSGQDATKWKHGANCYRNHGCRCDVCLDGLALKSRARRLRASKRASPTSVS